MAAHHQAGVKEVVLLVYFLDVLLRLPELEGVLTFLIDLGNDVYTKR